MMEAEIKVYCEFWWLFSSFMRLVKVEEKKAAYDKKM